MHLFEFVDTAKQSIVRAWETAVAGLPPAQRLSRPALIDHMPEFLDDLAVWLKSGSKLDAEVFSRFASEHALHRLGAGIELHHVTTEYRILRATILAMFAKVPGATASVVDMARFDEAIDHAVGLAVEQYMRARDEAREQLIDILAHDLRNPLGTVSLAAATLLESGALSPKQTVTIERVARSSDHMGRMVESLLDLARARLGTGLSVSPQPVDMGSIIRHVVDEASASNPGRTIQVESRGDLHGLWDPDLVARAITNLVSNALEHGEDPLRVVAHGEAEAGVTVEVSNHGPPIPSEMLPTLFEPYVRRAGNHARRTGLGLGLYITAEIVRAHGGSIEVRSGHETVFTVRWPRAHAVEHDDARASA